MGIYTGSCVMLTGECDMPTECIRITPCDILHLRRGTTIKITIPRGSTMHHHWELNTISTHPHTHKYRIRTYHFHPIIKIRLLSWSTIPYPQPFVFFEQNQAFGGMEVSDGSHCAHDHVYTKGVYVHVISRAIHQHKQNGDTTTAILVKIKILRNNLTTYYI